MTSSADSRSTVAAGLPYGRYELRRYLQRYFAAGLLISTALHLLVVNSYHLARLLGDDEEAPVVVVRLVKYSELGPPPSIAQASVPPAVGVMASAKPSVGLPVPVPDAEVSPEQTIPTQAELSTVPSPAVEGLTGGGEIEVAPDVKIEIEEEPGMEEFVPVEKLPQVVRRMVPAYPPMALRAGIEGTVWVKILVEKDGTPRKAVVVKSSTEIFNDAALEAAMQFLFTPAVMNNGPVRVWVAIPFRFTLRRAQPS
jgi:protein TonB